MADNRENKRGRKKAAVGKQKKKQKEIIGEPDPTRIENDGDQLGPRENIIADAVAIRVMEILKQSFPSLGGTAPSPSGNSHEGQGLGGTNSTSTSADANGTTAGQNETNEEPAIGTDKETEIREMENSRKATPSICTDFESLPLCLRKEMNPKFEKDTIPPTYLKYLREFFDQQDICSEKNKVVIALKGLQGDSIEWGKYAQKSIHSFADFEKAFLQRFWAETDKVAMRKKIFTVKFRSEFEKETLSAYFDRQYAKVVEFYPEMTISEILLRMKSAMPDKIKTALVYKTIDSVEKLQEYLKELDELEDLMELSKDTEKHSSERRNEKYNDQFEFSTRENYRENFSNYHGNSGHKFTPYDKNYPYKKGNRQNSQHTEKQINHIQNEPSSSRGRYGSYNHKYDHEQQSYESRCTSNQWGSKGKTRLRRGQSRGRGRGDVHSVNCVTSDELLSTTDHDGQSN